MSAVLPRPNRVKETSATTGTGTITLAGAVSAFQAFSAAGTGAVVEYMLLSGNGTDWEHGVGTYTLSGTTLSRDRVLESTNANAKIVLSGTSIVWIYESPESMEALPTNVKLFGAKADAVRLTDAAITSGAAILTSASAAFVAADVGKRITVSGAGAAGVVLVTTISSRTNATTVVLAANAGTTVSGAVACYGTNNATAFQAAIDAVNAAGGGRIFVPPGKWLLGSQIIIKSGVTFYGDHRSITETNGIRDGGSFPLPGDFGTWLYITHAPDTAPIRHYTNSNATIRCYQNSCLDGFGIYYPNMPTNTATDGTAPPDYPYAIELHERGVTVQNIELLNASYGLDLYYTHVSLVRNITGQVFKVGVNCSYIADIVRIENVHFNPWFAYLNHLFAWQQANGVAFRFGWCQFIQAVNLFGFGVNVGYHFVQDASNSESGSSLSANSCVGSFVNCSADSCNYPIYVVQTPTDYSGVEFTNFKGILVGTGYLVVVEAGNTGSFKISNSHFWGGAGIGRSMYLAGGIVQVMGCTFGNAATIFVVGGWATIIGNHFVQVLDAVNVQATAANAVVVGNISSKGSSAYINGIGAAAYFAGNL